MELKVETITTLITQLEKRKKLKKAAKDQQSFQKQEAQRIAELYPANTVKPKPIEYYHFRLELDKIVLDIDDVDEILKKLNITNAILAGVSKPDKDSYTYLCYTWDNGYYLLFPLCQDFFFITEDREHRLENKISNITKEPFIHARVITQIGREDDKITRIDAFYHIDGMKLIMERITGPDGPYYLDLEESTEKVRNLLNYLRQKVCYDMCREIGHTDLPNSVRIN